jgi:predicted dithiol-disulfide oxidoreductase (DUF899 family)
MSIAEIAPAINTTLPPIVSREKWMRERERLLVQEKALMRLGDLVAAQRRRLPMVEVAENYMLQGEQGPVSLRELFDGRPQLVLQHFMFHPDWEEGCVGCSMMADYIGPLAHLNARRTSFAQVSRAPLAKIQAYRERMGWPYAWVSSEETTFNQDFGVTVNDEEDQGLSVFLRDEDRIFHTWQTAGRGAEYVLNVFKLLDFTPYGRQEAWEDTPAGRPQDETYSWWQRHDAYEADGRVAPAECDCCGS